jgi:hypothetical protein
LLAIDRVLEYIYGQGNETGKISTYKGFYEYGEDYFLNSKGFKETYLNENPNPPAMLGRME